MSLLEALVAVSLLGAVGVLAAGGVSFGVSAWERSGAVADRSVEARVTQKFLRAALEGARAIRVRDGSRTPPVLFEGGPESLRFAAPLPAYLARRGAHLIELKADESGGVLARWTPLGDAPPEIPNGAVAELLGAAWGRIGFRYYGPDERGLETWSDHWRGRDRLPELVEISAETAGVAPVIVRLPVPKPTDR